MRRFAFAFLVVFGSVGPALAATTPEPRVALVIGNSAYRSAPLANPANDARLIAGTLRGVGFEVIERIDVDQKAMKRAIVEFGDRLEAAGSEAVGLFFYAGHGLQVNGENFLVPLSAEIEREKHVAIEAVSATWVLTQMEYAGNRTNFVILDACRNNPLVRSFRSAARGLARMDAPRGSLIAYSTGPGKVARDGDGANSPYTSALVREMRTPGVPVEQMFKQVRIAVMGETGDQQVPWEASSLTGNFFFAPQAQAAAATATVEQETVFWQSVKDSDDPASFEAYLGQYPNGAFAALARIRLTELRSARRHVAEAERQHAARALTDEAERRHAGVAGDWDTSFGAMNLTRRAGRIIGSYSATRHKGRIIAGLDGNVLTGFWIEPGSAIRCDSARRGSLYWGKVRFSFSGDFTAFRGTWSYCNGEPSHSWSGSRR